MWRDARSRRIAKSGAAKSGAAKFGDGRSAAVRLAAFAAVSALGACSTATPVVIQAARLPPDLVGRVNTTAGYTGEITTDNGQCRGSFTGSLGQAVAPLEVSCQDGRSGVGVAQFRDGGFVGGDVRLSDGSRLTIRVSGAPYP